MFKKTGCILLVIGLLVVTAWFRPWDKVEFSWKNLLGIENIKEYSGLSVFSLKDQLEVYIDNEFIDQVDATGGMLEIADIEPGVHRVTLRKDAGSTAQYYEFSKSINFDAGVSNVIAYELGPSREFSQGHVFYTEKKSINDVSEKTFISFLSSINEVEVYLDDKLIGKTPLEDYDIPLNKQYEVKLKKNGYEELSFKILPEADEERKKLNNLHLYIEAELFLKPFEIIKPQ